MDVPDDLRYTKDHEWVKVEGSRARIGITEYAQDALGDIVFVQIPDVGASVEKGSTVSEVESTKSVSDIYAPVSGSVVISRRRPSASTRIPTATAGSA
jgi:glycine cleavage system H protein